VGNEVHLYTFGADPFVLQLGDVAFYIHQGARDAPTPPVTTPPAAPEIFRPTKLSEPYANYIVAPVDARDLSRILLAQDSATIDLGVAVGGPEAGAGSTGEQLRAVLDVLSEYDAGGVSVHVVDMDALRHADGDG
jgi:hypothetical protein